MLRAFFQHDSLTFEKADALKSPPSDGVRLQSFDVVVSDLSESADVWATELGAVDPFGRFKYGIAPKGKGEWPYFLLIRMPFMPDMVPGRQAGGWRSGRPLSPR